MEADDHDDVLRATCRRMLEHHRQVLGLQMGMYRRAQAAAAQAAAAAAAKKNPGATSPSASPSSESRPPCRWVEVPPLSSRERKGSIAELMDDFDRLDAAMADLDAWSNGKSSVAAGGGGGGSKAGFGGGAGGNGMASGKASSSKAAAKKNSGKKSGKKRK